MNTEIENKYNEKKQNVLKEIQYRESVMRQLSHDINRKECFVLNFICGVLGIKKPSAPFYRKEPMSKNVIYNIDSDIDLQNDIYNALEKSKNKLIEVYNSIER